MTKQEIIAKINQFADEAIYCRSNREAREIEARKNSFAKEHHCEALMDEIFLDTGAGETLFDMILNYDDSIVPTMPKF